jgi:hypothetical protein
MVLRTQRPTHKTALLLGPLTALLPAVLPMASAQTTFSIENASGYSKLTPCASRAVNGVVRGQRQGCTMSSSYACFCSQSSSRFNSVVSRAVTKTCQGNSDAQGFATSAQAVFSDYCAMGAIARNVASSTSSSGSSTSSTSSSDSSSGTDTGTSSASPSSKKDQTSSSTPASITTTPHIDALPDYSAIQDCAKTPLNDIVRDLKSGCGNADATSGTSFNCLCNHHSSSINSVISSLVQTQCQDDVLVGQAQAVFSEYCDLGATPLTQIPQVIATPSTYSLQLNLSRITC